MASKVTFRQALNKPLSWWRKQSRSYILQFLAWNDRHGSYLDEDLEEGMEPLTKPEALGLVQMVQEEGAVASVKRNRKKKKTKSRKNPPSEGMLMGNLVSIEVRVNGRKKTIRPRGKYLGYLPRTKTLCIMHNPRSNPGSLSSSVNNLHRKFHNAGPTKVTMFTWPDPVGRKQNIGRIVAITYKIPKGMKSPDKKRYLWHHEFGDHGERGHGPVEDSGNYPEKLMPMLQVDSKGNFFIKRMPGNKFYVTDWLYW